MSGSIFLDYGLFQLKENDETTYHVWRCQANGPLWSDEQIDAFLRLEYHRVLRDEFERDVWVEREACQRYAQGLHAADAAGLAGHSSRRLAFLRRRLTVGRLRRSTRCWPT